MSGFNTHISYFLLSYVRLTNVPKYQSNNLSFVITKKAAQIVKVLLIVHTRPKCTNHMYQTVLNCPNHLINQSKVITWSILNADIEQLIQLIHFCLNVLSGDCGRRESRKCHNFNPNSFWIYVSGVCSLPLKCALDSGQWHRRRWRSWYVCRHALWLFPYIYVW